ncbi:MAG: RHS repeat protein [Dactylosporangium sp.]|nr:hypothetical protein [Dactylosporangium sp.]NNJ62317.1 RHS repeat protein [Dactylosporangium sp.]
MTTLSEHTYLRGMHGDQLPGGGTRSVTRTDSVGGSYVDENELAGFEIESASCNGSAVVEKTTTSPWRYETASQTWSWGGGVFGDPGPGHAGHRARAYLVRRAVLRRGAGARRSDQDRETRLARRHDGTTATFVTVTEGTFDTYGRQLTSTDATGATTTTGYTETDGLATAKVETAPAVTVGTTQVAFTTTTEFAPEWGQQVGQVDVNGRRTDLGYDALGRLTGVWLANRYQDRQTPSIRYSYTLDGVHPTAVMTEKVKISGEYMAEYQIYDGFLRPRQTQVPGPDGGRLVADTFYTATGQVAKANDTYYAEGGASGELLPSTNGDVDLQMAYVYDGADRVTDTITLVAGQERWRTVTSYGGDRTHVDPPAGGTPTTTITDARGQTVRLRQYHGDGPSGDFDATTYAYTAAGQLASVADPAGNVWSYGYDQRSRKVWADDPDAGYSTFGYDDLDRLTATTDARGVLLTTTYDVLGRRTASYEGDAATGTKLSAWGTTRSSRGSCSPRPSMSTGRRTWCWPWTWMPCTGRSGPGMSSPPMPGPNSRASTTSPPDTTTTARCRALRFPPLGI